MRKLGLIIEREYLSIVGRKSFLVMTLLMPILMLLCGFLPIGLSMLNESNSEVETIAVIDETGGYGKALQDDENYRFVEMDNSEGNSNPREFYEKVKGSVAGVIVIPRDVMDRKEVPVYSDNTLSPALVSHIGDCLSDTLTKAKLASWGVEGLQKMIDESTIDIDVNGVKWGDDGAENVSSSEVAMIIGLVLSLMTYMFVLSYGAMIMTSVVEEKTNRIVEIVVSSCKPFELMMGKVIGVGLVGLTQSLIWAVILGVLGSVLGTAFGVGMMGGGADALTGGVGAGSGEGIEWLVKAVLSVNYVQILVCFLLYFIGGYLLYASLFAGLGSCVDTPNDTSQLTLPVMVVMMVALYAGIACGENPNGPMAVWCSMIPFTSSIVMMVRLPYGVPLWQTALSVLLLYGTAAAMVWLSAKIYRNGILMYGKKLNLRDLVRMLHVGRKD